MNSQNQGNKGSNSAHIDFEQLMKEGEHLHGQAIFEALRGVIFRLKALFSKRADCSFEAYRMKEN